jgi:hypothetical protein
MKKNITSFSRQMSTTARPFDDGALTRKGNTRTGEGAGDGATSVRSKPPSPCHGVALA